MNVARKIQQVLKLLYWKACFPADVALMPPSVSVASGPFAGMPYSQLAQGSAVSAKVLGTYEMELHSVMSRIQQLPPYDTFIDIGAAEGYYVLGLGLTARPKTIIAYEMQDADRNLIKELVARNRVPNVNLKGRCEPEELKRDLECSGRTLIVCDVEGYEASLLDPKAVPHLRNASILVELHDFVRADLTGLIRKRFESSHLIDEVVSADRAWSDFPKKSIAARLLPRKLAMRAMNEGRPCRMSWFWMTPLSENQ